MPALARGQTSNCAFPQLDVFISVNGILTDVYSLEFQVFELVSNPGVPTQVYPVSGRQTVNVGITCPTANAGRISVGRYFATWTVPLSELIGPHRVKWFFKVSATSSEIVFQEDFEVLAEGTATGMTGYCTVQDLRDEGVTTTMADDAFLSRRIALASRFIDAATKRFFEPRTMTIKVDGKGGPKILLSDPIIAISEVLFDTTPYEPAATEIDPDLLVIYNRHLTQGLVSPDDRNNPKIELFHPSEMLYQYGSARTWSNLIFPLGQQNVTIIGVFGYTDPDPPNSSGKTPDLISHVCKLITIRELDKMTNTSARFDRHNRHRLTSERTRDQAYTLEGLGALGGGRIAGSAWTGDPEIDSILAYYTRPPALGAT
jgi:hypothetical protein